MIFWVISIMVVKSAKRLINFQDRELGVVACIDAFVPEDFTDFKDFFKPTDDQALQVNSGAIRRYTVWSRKL